jgi:hypothetical protein
MSASKRPGFRLNAPGDFYVEDGMCITCLAPEHEAPGLMGFLRDPKPGSNGNSHCYFARQPTNSDETYRAIRALWAGCCGALRYGGSDPEIIQRLVDLGLGAQVDGPTDPRARPVLRDHVTFASAHASGKPATILAEVGRRLVLGYSNSSVTAVAERQGSASLLHSWSSEVPGMELVVGPSADGQGRWLLTVGTGGVHPATSSVAMHVDDALRADGSVREIRWYSQGDWSARRERWMPLPC